MDDKTIGKSNKGWIKKTIIILVIIAAAWVLGQMAVPAFMKLAFLSWM
jgi:hypothetical protein